MSDISALDRSALIHAVRQPVKVTLPAKAAFDIDTFVKVQRDIFDRLGHSMCVSGFDIRWNFEDRFVVDEKLHILAQ